ncbi:hypothetical protein ABTZ78_17260 [Streptomyces bauhiniae]|uniref:hypothetical protein n=1 Tax=Streptomyces bauhiniae TaxID=2340725 RepID=UPI00331E3934
MTDPSSTSPHHKRRELAELLGHMTADKAARLLTVERRMLPATFAYAAARLAALPQSEDLTRGREDAVTRLRQWSEAARLTDATPERPTAYVLGLSWTGDVHTPAAGDASETVVLDCVTPTGIAAALVIEGDDRLKLSARLLDGLGGTPCPTPGCGSTEDWDPADPELLGWLRLEVAGLTGGPRWYCMPSCITVAMTRAGEELRTDDLDATYGEGAADEYVNQLGQAAQDATDVERGETEDGAL